MLAGKPYLQQIELKRDEVPSFKEYPFNIPAIRNLKTLTFHPDVTFLVGENGSGKSTLMEAMAVKLDFSPEGGTKNFQLSSADDISPLHDYLRVSRGFLRPTDHYFLRAESFYNVATYMDSVGYLKSYGGKSLHARSHGEAFMALLTVKLRGDGLYLFDEPEAALSPHRQLQALRAIYDLVKDGSQFIIATHSPILLSYPGAKIIQFNEDGLSEIKYEDTEHYRVTKMFLNNHQGMLHHLLKED
ncbi:MAG: ATPase [Verrucomicrobia bacterium]|nr:ATPase [Verrucomicrobiota bacterium]